MTHQKRNVVVPLGSGWDRLTGWNSRCSAVFSLLHSVTAVMVSSGLPIVVCVLCVSLLPSVWGKFNFFSFNMFWIPGPSRPKVKLKPPHHCDIATAKTLLVNGLVNLLMCSERELFKKCLVVFPLSSNMFGRWQKQGSCPYRCLLWCHRLVSRTPCLMTPVLKSEAIERSKEWPFLGKSFTGWRDIIV